MVITSHPGPSWWRRATTTSKDSPNQAQRKDSGLASQALCISEQRTWKIWIQTHCPPSSWYTHPDQNDDAVKLRDGGYVRTPWMVTARLPSFSQIRMANGKCPKPIPPLTHPSQSPIPPLNWAVALSIAVPCMASL